jgi:hypothetical protein
MASKERAIDRLSRQLAAEQASRPAGRFDYQSIAADLDAIVQPLLDAIGIGKAALLQEYEKGLVHVLALNVSISSDTWAAIRYLCREQPEAGWQRAFVYSVPPLARTLLDSLFTTIFLFDDPKANAHWFLAAGWSDQQRANKRFSNRYSKDPAWRTWLQFSAEDIKQTESYLVTLTKQERQSPEKPVRGYWPNPGKMGGTAPMRDKTRRKFLQYVNDWFYRELSGDSHLNLTGLLRRGGHRLRLTAGNDPEDLYQLTRSHFAYTALTIYLALLSEFSVELDLSVQKRSLAEMWRKLSRWQDAADLYQERYQALLS